MYLRRHLAIPLHRATRSAEPVLLEGPRGAGKTTLVRREFPGHLYIDLDEPSERRSAARDPERFLARFRRPAIVDSLERAPELARHLRETVVNWPLILVSNVRQGLTLPTFELHPPTRGERARRPALPLEILGRFVPAPKDPDPPLAPWPEPTRDYLYRDVPQLVQLADGDRFERLAEQVESRSGEAVNQLALARELGVAHRSVVRWLEVLEACFRILRIAPLAESFGRRVVQRPKLHWLGARTFETEVVTEIYRNARHAGQDPALRYWRDSNGLEVPLLLASGEGTSWIPLGIAETPNPVDESRIQRWMQLAGVREGAVIGRRLPLGGRGSGRVLRYALAQL